MQVERDGVVELAEARAEAGQVQPVHEIGVVRVHPEALAHQRRQEAGTRPQIDAALEVETVEPAQDLELADEVLEVLLRQPARRAPVVVDEVVATEGAEAGVELRREPAYSSGARPVPPGRLSSRPRSYLAYSFSK